ncbi:aspartate dehydrogenase [Aquincola sp. S2]|uniref:L-aspartate dehydrogenase n=1 Tax=Pseudaquabacterium terrae TaxID=2732868 RepID=A0ABX2ET14_9BURK|nr:aspartate dehydrogenase [Aquabacterium terrae]NRF71574.1 aspartate dehydrogenase [Aquabacterium terrae]
MTHDTAARAPLKVALIGLGAIGTALCEVLAEPPRKVALLGALVTQHPGAATTSALPMWTSLDALLDARPEVVAECAGHHAVAAHGERILVAGCDLLLASVGALADEALHRRLLRAAERGGARLLLTSGAIGGLDILAAAQRCGLHRVQLRSSKPPAAWRGTIAEARVDLDALKAPVVLFSGSAREAATLYPKNANVAATIALATLGWDHTVVELVANPGLQANVHQVDADGVGGRISIRIEGSASSNSRTSMLTAYSLANALLDKAPR